MEILGILFVVTVIVLIVVEAAHDTSREHIHSGHHWDGWTERCRCGVEASERVNPKTGLRCSEFKEWVQ